MASQLVEKFIARRRRTEQWQKGGRERRTASGEPINFCRAAQTAAERKTEMTDRRTASSAGRYVQAFSWHGGIDHFLRTIITETPLLHVCSGPKSDFGDVRCDRYVMPQAPGVMADWIALPFAANSFAAVFADPPWNLGQMKNCANFCEDAIRIAPIIYLMSPWLWVRRGVERTKIWVREMPGINVPILIVRYQRQPRFL